MCQLNSRAVSRDILHLLACVVVIAVACLTWTAARGVLEVLSGVSERTIIVL